MFKQQFYHNTLQKYLSAFGKLFSNIKIYRDNGTESQFEIVPIAYAPRERYVTREQQDPTSNKPIAMQLPRIAYDLISINRDPSRQFNSMQKEAMRSVSSTGQVVYYQPTAYTLAVELLLRGRNQDDMFQMFEQIVPYFTPSFNIKGKLIEGSDCMLDIPITIANITILDKIEGSFLDTREMIWSITFEIGAWMFGPDMSNSPGNKPILWVFTNTTEPLSNSSISSNSYVYMANTVITDIKPTDDYQIITITNELIE